MARSVPYLRNLNLGRTKVTGTSLEHLEGLTALRDLDLPLTEVNDSGLMHLSRLSGLERLTLWNTQVTDCGLKYLNDLSNLQRLDLGKTKVTDAGLLHLKRLTKLQSLTLSSAAVNSVGLEHLAGVTSLRTLNLVNCKIGDTGLVHLKRLRELEWLALGGTQVADEGLESLKATFPICAEPRADPGSFGHLSYHRALPPRRAHADLLCLAAIFVCPKTGHYASAGGAAGFGDGCARLPRDLPSETVSSVLRYAPPTDGGGIANRLIRPRIAANNSLGTATSASWKVTYFECRTTFAPILISLMIGKCFNDRKMLFCHRTEVKHGNLVSQGGWRGQGGRGRPAPANPLSRLWKLLGSAWGSLTTVLTANQG